MQDAILTITNKLVNKKSYYDTDNKRTPEITLCGWYAENLAIKCQSVFFDKH